MKIRWIGFTLLFLSLSSYAAGENCLKVPKDVLSDAYCIKPYRQADSPEHWAVDSSSKEPGTVRMAVNTILRTAVRPVAGVERNYGGVQVRSLPQPSLSTAQGEVVQITSLVPDSKGPKSSSISKTLELIDGKKFSSYTECRIVPSSSNYSTCVSVTASLCDRFRLNNTAAQSKALDCFNKANYSSEAYALRMKAKEDAETAKCWAYIGEFFDTQDPWSVGEALGTNDFLKKYLNRQDLKDSVGACAEGGLGNGTGMDIGPSAKLSWAYAVVNKACTGIYDEYKPASDPKGSSQGVFGTQGATTN